MLTHLQLLNIVFPTMTIVNFFISQAVAYWLSHMFRADAQIYVLIQCFSLLLLGVFLSALATLNFSLSFIVGLACTPLSFMRRGETARKSIYDSILLGLLSPYNIMYAISFSHSLPVTNVLLNAASEWHISGMWMQVVTWLIWWPAWFSTSVVVASPFYTHRKV